MTEEKNKRSPELQAIIDAGQESYQRSMSAIRATREKAKSQPKPKEETKITTTRQKPRQRSAPRPPKEIQPQQNVETLKFEWLKSERLNGASEKTLEAYRIGFEIFDRWTLENMLSLSSVTSKDINQFKLDLLKEYAPQTVNLRLSAVRSFFRFVVIDGVLHFSPAQIVKGAKRPKSHMKKRDPLTDDEVRALLATCGEDDISLRDMAIMTLMLYCGLRRVELCRADVEDLSTKGGHQVLWVQGKGRIEKDELVVIPPSQEHVIRKWLAVRPSGKTDALFTSLSLRSDGERLSERAMTMTVKSRMVQAGIIKDPKDKKKSEWYKHGRKSVHSLRHTAITKATQAGATLRQVQQMARHENIDTTMGYIHAEDRLKAPAELLISYE